MNRVMNHIVSNLYSAFVANLSNKSDTVMLFGIFHKSSASSLVFVSGILPCLGESSSRPLFPVPSAGTETSTTTPARTSQRCQPLLLPLFHIVRQSPTASAPPTSFFRCALKNVWVPWLITRGCATVHSRRRDAAPTDVDTSATWLQPRQSAYGRHRAGLTFPDLCQPLQKRKPSSAWPSF